jgi:diguanylate cyclase (GGDEF)-like protein
LDNFVFTSLVSPAIAFTLAVPFAALWANRRERLYLLLIALAYVGAGCGFLLQTFMLPFGFAGTKLLSNVAFVLAALSIASAIATRYGRRVPWLPLAAAATLGLAGFCWFLLVKPDLALRVLSTNLALGGITLIVASELSALPAQGRVERALIVLALLSGVNFLIRPIALIALHDQPLTYETLHASAYWTTTLLTHAVFSLLIAFCLLTAEALDVIEALRSESVTDPLSGLLNRRGFETQAAELLERSRSARQALSLVVADLDRFKSLNDRYGHALGDRVIEQFGALLNRAKGPDMLAARLGGEEFAVMLPMAGPATARLFAEDLRARFSALVIEGLQDAEVTASFGVASRLGDMSLEELVRRADEALYVAKKEGRDNVRVYRGFASAKRPSMASAMAADPDMGDYILKTY